MKQKIKKAGHIAFHLMQSISTKVVLIILILVLPLNILAIVLSHAAIEAMTEQAALSVTSVMENYNTELLHRMEDTGYLLWNMKNEDTDGTILAGQKGDEQYLGARIRFYHKFLNNMRMVDGADGYFFHMPEVEDTLVWDITGAGKINGEDLYFLRWKKVSTRAGMCIWWTEAAFMHVRETQGDYLRRLDISG